MIPQPLTSFVGREREITAIAQLINRGTRLLTLSGPGGVGKTRLAIAAAQALNGEIDDGAVFVSLAAMSDPALVLPAVARSLDIRETPGRPLFEVLVSALRQRRVLLVLDNFEHVLPGAVDIARLLEACPLLTALATSREPLGVRGEQRFLTSPLALPDRGKSPVAETIVAFDAIRLFVERAQLVDREFALSDETVAAVAEICRRLDGLPLAIELAAAWVRLFSPQMILERLERRLPLLSGGGEDQPARLRTMRDAIAWSYHLLSAEEARHFRRLSVFIGGFTLEAVEAIAPPSVSDPLAALQALVDHSLVRRDVGVGGETPPSGGDSSPWKGEAREGAGHGGVPRFTMLETIREYALERLAASGEEVAARDAHAAWCLSFAEQHAPDFWRDDDVVERAGAIASEHANMLAALDHFAATDADEAHVRLAASLGHFWFLCSRHSVGREFLERALVRPTALPAAEAAALANLAQLAMFQGDHAAAAGPLARAEERAMASGDPLALSSVRCRQATLAVFEGDYATGQARAAEAEALARGGHDPLHAALARFLRARAIHYAGDLECAESLYRAVLADPPPPRYAEATYRSSLAMIACARGHHAEALELYAAPLPVFLDIGEYWSVATGLEGVATALGGLGRTEAAARLFGAAAALRTTTGTPMLPPDVADYERAVASVRAELGPEAFSAAWDAGGALSAAAAVAEATAQAATALAAVDPIDQPRRAVADAHGLTRRERDVLTLLVDGCSDKEIADVLFVTRRSASKYVSAVLAKLGVPSRGAAIAMAVRDGLVPPPAPLSPGPPDPGKTTPSPARPHCAECSGVPRADYPSWMEPGPAASRPPPARVRVVAATRVGRHPRRMGQRTSCA